MTDAFDADVIIFAAGDGPRALASLQSIRASDARLGSVVLLPQVLIKPLRFGGLAEASRIDEILATFDLIPVDEEIADTAVTLGAKYRLKSVDAVHLATAVVNGAERFFTNNTKDFGDHITEIDVVVPA